jgi:16S rRNA (uracil1498-N3)-methyltransferase
LAAHPGGSRFEELKWDKAIPTQLALGPEGGFTDDEIALARQQGWQILGLGERILRIETAALALIARLTVA